MKRIFTLMMIAAIALPSLAQFGASGRRDRFNHSNAEQYYGLRLGLNIASLSSDNVDFDMNSRSGLAFGAIYGFQLANSTPLWLETGLFYSEKGGKTSWEFDDGTQARKQMQTVKTRLSYLQLPIVMKYSFDVMDDLYIQPFVGGYFSLGVGGKTKEYGLRESYSSFDVMNRFDGGLRLGCGVEYQMVYGELGFDFGITNISKSDFDSVRNRCFFVNIGVNF
ncbi:MAG: PorT family protein [Prevotella sp.]|nr:PorT family protein [Prevotella sp.]